MSDHQITDLARDDVVDTSRLARFLIEVDGVRTRGSGTMPEELAAIIERLTMGRAVQRSALQRWGLAVLEICEIPQIDTNDPEQLKRFGITARPKLTLVD